MDTEMLTVVAIDMVGYSIMAGSLDDAVGADAVELLHKKLLEAIDDALLSSNTNQSDIAHVTYTGDGEIRFFLDGDRALAFSEAIHKAGKRAREKWYFRVGVSVGEVSFDRAMGPSSFAITIARRLEAAANPGEIVIHQDVFNKISKDQQALFSSSESITVKHNDHYNVHRRQVVPLSAKKSNTGMSSQVTKLISSHPAEVSIGAATALSLGAFLYFNHTGNVSDHAQGMVLAGDIIQNHLSTNSWSDMPIISGIIADSVSDHVGGNIFRIIVDLFNPF